MKRHLQAFVALGFAAGLLAGCSSSQTAAPDLAPTAPEPSVTTEPLQPLETGPLTAGQISRALAEKTFSFASAGRKGTVTYYGDGTFEYQETGKGTGTGVWQASDGKLCEARNPASFLPKGTPSVCNPFSSDGTKYIAGNTQLIPG
jgi:hypothetical protein